MGSENFVELWLTKWSNEAVISTIANNGSSNETVAEMDDTTRNMYIYVYSSMSLIVLILSFVGTLTYFTISLRASTSLHNRMYDKVIQTSMRFFHINPIGSLCRICVEKKDIQFVIFSGRILNRFTKDLGEIDEFLPMILIDAILIFIVVFGNVFLVIFKTPWMLIPTVILGSLLWWWRKVFLKSSVSVKRIEGARKNRTLFSIHVLTF